jgi:hypothetical protein
LLEVIRRFASSKERQTILRGLLKYRRALGRAGFTHGFQWLDGSFVENVEQLRERPPADLDVVTFVELGGPTNQRRLLTLHPELFVPAQAKEQFHVDGYFVDLGTARGQELVRRITYWYSMWAHRRDDLRWKGFVEVALGSADEDEAARLLDSLLAGQPGEPEETA